MREPDQTVRQFHRRGSHQFFRGARFDLRFPRAQWFRQIDGHPHALRILEPSDGSARVNGIDVIQQTEQLKGTIGYMSQKFSLYDELTVMENLNFYSRPHGFRGPGMKTR